MDRLADSSLAQQTTLISDAPAPTIPTDVFADYDPVDPIDQELVQLGRLMQSLAVHCRQLVQVKMQYKSIENYVQHPFLMHQYPNELNSCEYDKHISSQNQSHSQMITSITPTTMTTSITTDASSIPMTISSQQSETYYSPNRSNSQNTKPLTSKSNEAIPNGLPLLHTKDTINNNNISTRVPRMGTRMEPSVMGSVSSNDSGGLYHDKKINAASSVVTPQLQTMTTTGEKSCHSRFPSSVRGKYA
ncbi:unnamed protein product [Trichobilharzia regenti]|nr:unnamed protein product [Trichobilharzia regenti]